MTAFQRQLQSLQGDAAGEHNLALVLSNLHFPWCLGEVDVSSCFLSEGDLSYVCVLGATPFYFWLGKRKCFFLAYFSTNLESVWDSETLQHNNYLDGVNMTV